MKSSLEPIFQKMHYDKNYEDWVRNFSLNLSNIWKEKSARVLDTSKRKSAGKKSAIVIGAGPSVKKFNHLELLSKSHYKGTIICTDRMLIPSLKAGITPDKFRNYYVATIDPLEICKEFYRHKIVNQYGKKIKAVFSTVIHPNIAHQARKAGIKIHWVHPLFDYDEGRKSFNQISALMVRAKNHLNGLPAIQTGGNVGTSSWFIAWKIMKCSTVALIGMNQSWDEDVSLTQITKYCNLPKNMKKNDPLFKKLFPRIYNPMFGCYSIQGPFFQYYSNALKEFIKRSPKWLTTINATEGGCLFGDRIYCMPFKKFLVDK